MLHFLKTFLESISLSHSKSNCHLSTANNFSSFVNVTWRKELKALPLGGTRWLGKWRCEGWRKWRTSLTHRVLDTEDEEGRWSGWRWCATEWMEAAQWHGLKAEAKQCTGRKGSMGDQRKVEVGDVMQGSCGAGGWRATSEKSHGWSKERQEHSLWNNRDATVRSA